MSSQSVIDFLTKQIFIERNIVTYRSLSRELRIHVNTAKNELAVYHNVAPYQSQIAFATYLLSGEVLVPGAQGDSQDVEMDYGDDADKEGEYEDDGEDVPQTTIMLVNEKNLEVARSKFTHLNSIHVYSLSPAPIRDAGLICAPTDDVRIADRGKDAVNMASIVGKIVGPNIKAPPPKVARAPRQPAAGPSKVEASSTATPLTKPTEKPIVDQALEEKSTIAANQPKGKPKATGKLDFTKVKTKETKELEATTEQRKKEVNKSFFTSNAKNKDIKDKLQVPVRGTKRKSLVATSGSEDDDRSSATSPKSPSPTNSIRLKNRTVLSDEDDDHDDSEAPQPTRKARINQAMKIENLEAERDLKLLMDIDDDQVIRVPRKAPVKEEEEESGEDTAEQDAKMAPPPSLKPKKRRQKKIIPTGSNGLKKKRVIKSRTTTDAKGYIVCEDYSSYESVDENEEQEQGKGKAKAKAKSSSNMKTEEEDSTTSAPKLKPTTKNSAKPGKLGAGASKGAQQKQKSLANFFTAPSKPKN